MERRRGRRGACGQPFFDTCPSMPQVSRAMAEEAMEEEAMEEEEEEEEDDVFARPRSQEEARG